MAFLENKVTSLSFQSSKSKAGALEKELEIDRKFPYEPSIEPFIAAYTKKKTKPKTRKRKHSKQKSNYQIWTHDDDALLIGTYPHLSPSELHKLFPNRTPDAIDMRAARLHIKKTYDYIRAKNSANPSKYGIVNLADHPVQALEKKYPELKIAYDNIIEKLLMHPAVDPENVLQVELLKEAALHKVMQYILIKDRIENGLKGKQLIFNPKNGMEYWVESRYPHSLDIANDARIARQILKDLGIIEDSDKKSIDVTGSLRFLWEDTSEENNEKRTILFSEQ